MALVEETARYLDGRAARKRARCRARRAMLYAGESMRVTTRLMQAASWLLVQRAVHDGDMERRSAASSDRYRLGSKEICLGDARRRRRSCCRQRCAIFWSAATISIAASPRLDDVLFGDGARAAAAHAGAQAHIDRLEQAFGARLSADVANFVQSS